MGLGMILYAPVMTNPTRAELAQLGILSTMNGTLRQLRERVQLSRNAQAHLIDVTPDALRRWEEGEQGMNHASAVKVGEWVWAAQRALEDAERSGIDPAELVPLTTASQYLSLSAEEIAEKCQTGVLRCESLGVLGSFVYRSHVPRLNPEEQEL